MCFYFPIGSFCYPESHLSISVTKMLSPLGSGPTANMHQDQ